MGLITLEGFLLSGCTERNMQVAIANLFLKVLAQHLILTSINSDTKHKNESQSEVQTPNLHTS